MPRMKVDREWEEAVWEFLAERDYHALVWLDLGPCMGTIAGPMELRPVILHKVPREQAHRDFLAMHEGTPGEAERDFEHWWRTAEAGLGGPIVITEDEYRLIEETQCPTK